MKNNLEAVDSSNVLELVNDLTLYEWSYTAQAGGVRHMEPMPPEFYAA